MSSVCLIHMSCQNKARIMYEKGGERKLQNDLITISHTSYKVKERKSGSK